MQSALLPSIAMPLLGDSAAASPPSTAPCLEEAKRVYKRASLVRGDWWERAEAEHRDLEQEDIFECAVLTLTS